MRRHAQVIGVAVAVLLAAAPWRTLAAAQDGGALEVAAGRDGSAPEVAAAQDGGAQAPGAPRTQAEFASQVAAIDAYAGRLEKLGFAGVLVVARDGKTHLSRGCGFADRENRRRWTSRTVSDIGSITKQFTAAAILRLEEQGKLRVDDSITKYFADVPDDKQAILLHHLLTHTSGISDVDGMGDWDAVDRDGLIGLTMLAPLAFDFGTRWEYSNAGYSLLGAVIEKVTGKSYEEALHELVLAPAGLKHTGYVLPKWDRERIAQGYRGGERWGTTLERPFAADGPYWILRANGGIHSTADDMVRWAYALLDDRVLSAASRRKMWERHADESNGEGKSFYGYGWSLVPGPGGRDLVTHNGGNGIHFADLGLDPLERIVVFMQTNVAAEFPAGTALLGDIGAYLYAGQPLPDVPDVDTRADLAPYAGTYILPDSGRIEVRVEEGTLALVTHRWDDYARLYSPPGSDWTLLEAKSAGLERILRAYMQHDYAPLAEAYGGRVPPERLRERTAMRRRADEERLGELQRIAILGTAATERGATTLARFEFARGTEFRRWFWDPEGDLRGMSGSQVGPPARFHPLVGGGFETYEFRAHPARIAITPDNGAGATLEFGAGGDTRRARRDAGTPHSR